MGLSSTVLWHQTKKDAFFKILKSKRLYYSYSQEYVLSGDMEKPTAFPMISLCDLPLSEFASNNWTYGDFAIGFSRDWGIKNKVNPVCYCHKGSSFLNQLFGSFKEGLPNDAEIKLLNCCAYLKYVQGPLQTSNKKFKNYRFYDEREVRLVPDPETEGIKFMLDKAEYEQYKKEHGNSLTDEHVNFEYEDILYIVANTPDNLSKAKAVLLKNIKKDGKSGDSKKDGENNEDKIGHIVFLTKEQIIEDVIGSNHNEEDKDSEKEELDGLLDAIFRISRNLRAMSK